MKLDRTLLDKGRPPTVAEMKDYFKKNDYTTAPPTFDTSRAKREEMNVYMKAKAMFKENWLKNQAKFGGNGSFKDLSENHPLVVLEHADEDLISGAVTNIISDPVLYGQIIESFYDAMQPQIKLAIDTYAQKNNKNVDDLIDDELAFVIDKFVDLFLDKMVNLQMQSQSVPELIKGTNEIGTHEDFSDRFDENFSRADFYRKWDHTRTKMGKIFSFSEVTDDADAQADLEENLTEAHTLGYSENEVAYSEKEFMKFENAYWSLLDEVERKIYDLRKEGCTTQVIAKDLGFKSHSTVVKKLKKMREKFDQLCIEVEKAR